jgi:hypothetical protein
MDSSLESNYSYNLLSGPRYIRVLRLFKSKSPDDPLKAELFELPLNKRYPTYEATSYTWSVTFSSSSKAYLTSAGVVNSRTITSSSTANGWPSLRTAQKCYTISATRSVGKPTATVGCGSTPSASIKRITMKRVSRLI